MDGFLSTIEVFPVLSLAVEEPIFDENHCFYHLGGLLLGLGKLMHVYMVLDTCIE